MTDNGIRPIHPGEALREEFLIPLGLIGACAGYRFAGFRAAHQ